MSDPTYPCPFCNRYSCRCSEPTSQHAGQPADREDWTPWWTALAGNA